MPEPDPRLLLMGYLDGELEGEERARIEALLDRDETLRRELSEMRKLVEATRELSPDARSDEELESFWRKVHVRLERGTAWVLLLAGAFGLTAFGLYVFFASPERAWPVKLAGALALLGAAGLLSSVWRERRRILPHDRYTREVDR